MSTAPPSSASQEAHELLLAREEVYGDMVDSWRRIAEEVSRRTGGYVSAETALWVLIEMKLERFRHSSENADHLRDAVGYLAILSKVQAAEHAEWETSRLERSRCSWPTTRASSSAWSRSSRSLHLRR